MDEGFREELEKRRFARVSNKFFLRSSRIDSSGDPDETKNAGIVHDISEAGVSFLTGENYNRGDILDLEIELAGVRQPSGDSKGLLNSAVVVIRGVVVRSEMFDTGLHLIAASFETLEKGDRSILLQAISYLQD